MLTIEPDFTRRIDLPRAGPCPRPVDIDRDQTGFATLVSLRVYSFARDMVIDGEAEDDELFIVLMRGTADIGVDHGGKRAGDFALRADGGLRAVYLPPNAAYRLAAVSDCDVAYARATPAASRPAEVRGFAPIDGRLDVSGHATGMGLVLAALAAGEDLGLAGSEGRSPERLLHVRCDGKIGVTVSGRRLGDWDSAVLADGERATLEADGGTADVLAISASVQ